MGQALASFDLKIVTSANPFALSTLLRDEDPDLVLVDLGMPAIRGDKLIELARKDGPPRATFVLFSGGADEELAWRAKACGADGYVRKGGEPDALARVLHGLIAAKTG